MSKLLIIGGGINPPGLIERYLVTRQELIDQGYTVAASQEDDVLQQLALKQCQETMYMLTNRDCPEIEDFVQRENNSWQQMNKGQLSKKQRRGKL